MMPRQADSSAPSGSSLDCPLPLILRLLLSLAVSTWVRNLVLLKRSSWDSTQHGPPPPSLESSVCCSFSHTPLAVPCAPSLPHSGAQAAISPPGSPITKTSSRNRVCPELPVSSKSGSLPCLGPRGTPTQHSLKPIPALPSRVLCSPPVRGWDLPSVILPRVLMALQWLRLLALTAPTALTALIVCPSEALQSPDPPALPWSSTSRLCPTGQLGHNCLPGPPPLGQIQQCWGSRIPSCPCWWAALPVAWSLRPWPVLLGPAASHP